MKRFYRNADVAARDALWQVMLDGRGVKTQGGHPQLVPTAALARRLAAEWECQGEDIDPAHFMLRDMADHAIDVIAPAPAEAIVTLLRYAETDTLCYRAEPEEPLAARQDEVWEPLLKAAEARYDVHFERIGGVIHRPQPAATLSRLETALAARNPFALAALTTLTTRAASLVVGLAALEQGADAQTLWDAANLEEDWQAELWGKDGEAEARRAGRLAAFTAAMEFAAAAG